VNVSITDTYGRTVQVLSDKSYSAGNHTIFWDVENLNPGIYLVTIKTEGGFISKRVVVAK
ncbi:MAG: T9SS type A sorting domain-containing protein, partial [Bacteroidetes bacterium]|nr:T9SS type A sorting domain-containing protein [Bacteroidota bacterium]